MDKRTSILVMLILVIVATGLFFLDRGGLGRRPTAFCAIAAALVTFFWFISGARRDFASEMRTAIAASLIVLYVVLIGIFSFWQPYTDSVTREVIPTADITTMLLNNFTYIIGVVIAFYFGSSAYIEAKREGAGEKKDTSEQLEN